MRFQDCYHRGVWTHAILWDEDEVYLGAVYGGSGGSYWWSLDVEDVEDVEFDAPSRREAKAAARKRAREWGAK